MELLERESERAQLRSALEEAGAEHGSLAFIEGSPGAGKSSLLTWLAGVARERGWGVVEAAGTELERELAFEVAQGILGPLPDAADTRGSIQNAHLALSERAGAGPIVLIVDDAHWADEASLRWLAFSGRRLRDLCVLMVVAARPHTDREAGDALGAIVDAARLRLRVGSLSDGAVAALTADRMGRPVEAAFAAASGHLSAGNPLFADALARAAHLAGLAPVTASIPALENLCPPSVVAFVARQVARLGSDARSLAASAAILEHSPLRRAAALAEIDLEIAVRAADELRGAEILAGERDLRFAHPMGRTAVVESLPAGERARLHARAARMLLDEGVAEDRVAGHLLAAEPAGAEWVVEALRSAAASAVARGAPQTGALLLGRALDEPPPPSLRTELLAQLGRALLDVDPAAALTPLTTALRAEPPPGSRVQLALEIGRARFSTGDVDGAIDVLTEALAFDPDDSRIEGELLGHELFAGAHENRTRRLARLADEKEPLVAVHRALGGPTAEVAAARLRGVWGEGTVARPGWTTTPLPIWITFGFIYCGALHDAAHVAERWAMDARAAGAALRLAYAEASRSEIAWRMGDLRAAEAHAEQAWELARDLGRDVGAWWNALAALVQARTGRGATDAAGALLRETGMLEAAPDLLLQPSLRVARAAWLDACGHRAEAADELIAWGRWLEARIVIPGLSFWRQEAAERLARAGRKAQATELAAAALLAARRHAEPIGVGAALRASALASTERRDTSLLEESVRILEGTPARHQHARSLLELGSALRRGNHRSAARDPLRAALDAFARCGAAADAERARTELRAAGARPRRASLVGVDALTTSELRVGRLAAAGMSNPEIATELWITRKTVEKHLAGAFAKLGIRQRQDLPAALAPEPNGGEPE